MGVGERWTVQRDEAVTIRHGEQSTENLGRTNQGPWRTLEKMRTHLDKENGCRKHVREV